MYVVGRLQNCKLQENTHTTARAHAHAHTHTYARTHAHTHAHTQNKKNIRLICSQKKSNIVQH